MFRALHNFHFLSISPSAVLLLNIQLNKLKIFGSLVYCAVSSVQNELYLLIDLIAR